MSPYREPEPLVHTDRVITLLPAAPARFSARRVAWGVISMAYIGLALDFVVEPLTEDQSVWRLVLCLAAWVVLPFVLLREARRGALQIGATSLRQVGVLSDRVVRWTEISGVEHVNAVGLWSAGPSIRLRPSDGVLEIPAFGIVDPKGMLDWAVDAALDGRFHDIAERVRREGRPPCREGRSWVPIVVMLLVFGMLGVERYMDVQGDPAQLEDLERCVTSDAEVRCGERAPAAGLQP